MDAPRRQGRPGGERAPTTTATTTERVVSRDLLDAALFDLDGVLTDTAVLHRAAWARLFDDYLAGMGEPHRFTVDDYLAHVDGKAREDGVKAYLAARGLPAQPATVRRLAATKDGYFQQLLVEEGPHVLATSVDLVRRLRAAGFGIAVVSASRHCQDILDRARLTELVDVRVDGVVAAELGLAGKPDPATFLEAARRLECPAERAMVVEDSQAGVVAGRRGHFGLVVGLDRQGQGATLREAGADLVLTDLAEIRVEGPGQSGTASP